MPLDLETFIETMASYGGPAKSTHFAVSINPPNSLQSLFGTRGIKTLSLFCEAASLPGLQLGLDDGNRPYGYGPVEKMPWGAIFSDMQLSFYADNRGFISQVFSTWLDSIVPFNDDDPIHNKEIRGYFVNYRSEYAGTVNIRLYDPKNQTIMTYTLYDCFPVAVYDQNVAWSAQGEILKVSVRFTFTRWTHQVQSASQGGAGLSAAQSAVGDFLRGDRNVDFSGLSTLFGNQFSSQSSQPVQAFVDNYKQAIPLLGGRDYFT